MKERPLQMILLAIIVLQLALTYSVTVAREERDNLRKAVQAFGQEIDALEKKLERLP